MVCPRLLITANKLPSLPVPGAASPPQAMTIFFAKYEYELPSVPVTISKPSVTCFMSVTSIFVLIFTLSLSSSSFNIVTNSFALSPAG